MEQQQYNYQAPRQPLFNGTVFITVLVALLTFGALAFGAFFLFNKMKNAEQNQISNEDVDAQKAINAQNALASGLKKSKKVAQEPIAEIVTDVVEETVEVVNTVVEKTEEEIIEAANKVARIAFNQLSTEDKMLDVITRKYPHILVTKPENEVTPEAKETPMSISVQNGYLGILDDWKDPLNDHWDNCEDTPVATLSQDETPQSEVLTTI